MHAFLAEPRTSTHSTLRLLKERLSAAVEITMFLLQRRALRTITTLPRLMLPRLSGFKQVAKTLGFGVSPLAVGSAAALPR